MQITKNNIFQFAFSILISLNLLFFRNHLIQTGYGIECTRIADIGQ